MFKRLLFKRLLIAALLASPLCVWAADDKAKTPQQEKMASCNKEAADKSLKGDDRKKFMSECLRAAKMSQQEKMKACNKDAGEKALKGDERKKFMSECLKGPAKS
jgi:psiF repeat